MTPKGGPKATRPLVVLIVASFGRADRVAGRDVAAPRLPKGSRARKLHRCGALGGGLGARAQRSSLALLVALCHVLPCEHFGSSSKSGKGQDTRRSSTGRPCSRRASAPCGSATRWPLGGGRRAAIYTHTAIYTRGTAVVRHQRPPPCVRGGVELRSMLAT
jgi:hypothetical protein